ncbi:MAG: hypothetical protein IT479_11075 [Xanthomonadales bacterium]|nr:hypothetical protein [Xanthomonadales bacterium]MCC6593805.1 hypothetical protein [Xanthomonadales bacterium]MCE7931192.1 hypothetical protein [Xanthomonadales bacterium PRO6]
MLRLPCLIALLSLSLAAPAQVVDGDAAQLQADPASACSAERCVYPLGRPGDEVIVERDGIERIDAGQSVFRIDAPSRTEAYEMSAITGSRNLVFAVLGARKITQGANVSAALGSGGLVHPRAIHRAFKFQAINSKSGQVVKEFELGQFKPTRLHATRHGESLLVAGLNLSLKQHEVLVLNARSGEVVHRETVEDEREVQLAANGYSVDGRARLLSEDRPGGESRYASRDQFSMAEYIVACEAPLKPGDYAQQAFAFLRFENTEATLDDSMSAAASIGLASKGLTLVERRRMDEILRELQFQSLGLTSEEVVADIGRLGNARYLVIGNMETVGADANVGLRAIEAESGTVVAGCAMRCRDCRPQDYAEGVGYLVDAWVR